MALSLSKALNIERDERGLVFLLLTQSVFLGIFAGALDVGANSLFLEAYSADLMPRAFMISGAVGIIFTSGYTFLQKRMPFKLFTILNLLVAILLTSALRFGYSLSDDPRLAFALLVIMGPVIIISMLGFWGTAGRYFTLRDGKRLFGIIDTGSIIGMILAFYAVPILVRFSFRVYDTLLIGAISLVMALLFQIIVLQRHKLIEAKAGKGREKEKRNSGFFALFQKRYTSMMAFFVMLSVICGFFIHYSFMWATQANYPDSRDLTGFLGAFFGTMMIFTVILKSTLYSWLMKNYGLRVTLLISPALLLVLTLVASFVGGIFGYSAGAAGFTFFFLLLALSKLFNKSLKDSIESPSMKILYQSLDSNERFDVQARIDGVINELTAFSSGLIMAGLLFLSFVTVIHFSYVLIALLIIWVVIGVSLYRSYRRTLNESLATAKSTTSESESEEKNVLGNIQDASMFSELIQLDPYLYYEISEEELNALLTSDDLRKREIAWKFISDRLFVPAEGLVENALQSAEKVKLKKIIESYSKRLKLPGRNLDKAFRSQEKDEVLSALFHTLQMKDVSQVPHLITLLRDRDIEIRAAAIEAAGKLKVRELGSYLVDYIGHPELYDRAWSALVYVGEDILENLENTFHKNGVEITVQLRIVKAMARIGGKKANAYLFNKLDHHQREVREAAIFGLYQNDFRPNELEMVAMERAIYQVALAGGVSIASEFVIKENDPGNGLYEAIFEELKRNNDLLFALLGIAFDKSAIKHVQESIEDPETLDAGFALELLNLIVSEQVYAYLEPYFDDLSISEKIRRLQSEMPVEILSYEDLLIDILNRDSLFTGNYLRVCAIDAIGKLEEIEAGKYLAAQVFHPNPVISKSASMVLAAKDAVFQKEVSERLRLSDSQKVREVARFDKQPGPEILETIARLSEWAVFSGLSRESLFRLIVHFHSSVKLSGEDPNTLTLIKTNGAADLPLSEGILIKIGDYPELFDQIDYLASQQECSIYQLDADVFRELLFDDSGLLETCRNMFSRMEFDTLIKLKEK